MLMCVVLGSSVLSKLTLVNLTGRLRKATHSLNATRSGNITLEERNTAVTLYWYLQFIVLIPNLLTFLRCLVFGVVGKTTITFPWPNKRALVLVSLLCVAIVHGEYIRVVPTTRTGEAPPIPHPPFPNPYPPIEL